jgi:hypothetical protein
MKRTLAIIISILLMQHTLSAQSKLLLENYYYKDMNSIVPMIHVETKDDWYAELRHNYEDAETFSLYAGKTFRSGNEFEFSITPLLGYAVGKFTGPSLALNTDMEWRGLFFSSQNQYSLSARVKEESFFFSWAEVGYSVSDVFFTGITLQYTRLNKQNTAEPGFLAGLSLNNISFPCYLFKPFQRDRYFVLGLNYEFDLKRKPARK